MNFNNISINNIAFANYDYAFVFKHSTFAPINFTNISISNLSSGGMLLQPTDTTSYTQTVYFNLLTVTDTYS